MPAGHVGKLGWERLDPQKNRGFLGKGGGRVTRRFFYPLSDRQRPPQWSLGSLGTAAQLAWLLHTLEMEQRWSKRHV